MDDSMTCSNYIDLGSTLCHITKLKSKIFKFVENHSMDSSFGETDVVRPDNWFDM
jgi:hypothetical protein